ncbi:hypothetical protein EYF80_035454 [Liparis tanakae]|uniref:Uncharacterized protein n=1 Tax=Liparis tanakae TaxID=230148 RepID=A0A4Z2GNH1_9TELE|nr:hypothetical protein EYF80_035454 [Liparis tanakae]
MSCCRLSSPIGCIVLGPQWQTDIIKWKPRISMVTPGPARAPSCRQRHKDRRLVGGRPRSK